MRDCFNCRHFDLGPTEYPCYCCNEGYTLWETEEVEFVSKTDDQVHQPAHYTEYPKEVVDIIKFTLTEEQFKGWCIGNELKYRLRAGLKDPDKLYEDLDKAMKIRQWRK